jgi:hypothetical protein
MTGAVRRHDLKAPGGANSTLGNRPFFIMPAKAGTQATNSIPAALDPRFRGATTKRNQEPYVRFTSLAPGYGAGDP